MNREARELPMELPLARVRGASRPDEARPLRSNHTSDVVVVLAHERVLVAILGLLPARLLHLMHTA